MFIDLRTEGERNQKPRASDIQIEVPKPPLDAEQMCWLVDVLFEAVGDAKTAPTIKVFCAKGIRSGLAAGILRAAGYRVIDLGGVR